MILLLGGTSETAPIARDILAKGWPLVVSTATDVPLELPPHVQRRHGRLDTLGLIAFGRSHRIRILVDATHPFASQAHHCARRAAEALGIPYLRFERPAEPIPPDACTVQNHEDAAREAFALGGGVLVTTGSRHLEPYVQASRATGQALIVRVLDHPESLRACERAGLSEQEIHAGRGPFGLEDTLRLLERVRARAIVTKASGSAGGFPTKVEAARCTGARLIVIDRPPNQGLDRSELIQTLSTLLEVSHAPF